MMRYDVTALGEVLIDFTYAGKSKDGTSLFEQNPGGAPANVLTCLSRLGHSCAFIGKVGCDLHGDYLTDVLKDSQIDVSGLMHDTDVFTTLAFVALSESGERSFSFARKPGADTCLKPDEIDCSMLESSRIFHFGSLSLTDLPVRDATWHALKTAKAAGCVISYDPNYRPLLWESRDAAIDQMRSVLEYVDMIKISDEECELMTGETSPEAAAQVLLNLGISVVAVTLGPDGALVATSEGMKHIPTFPCTVADTTGAGDSFWGGFLSQFIKSETSVKNLTLEQVSNFAKYANAVASLCVEKRGAIPAMPTAEQVDARIDSNR